MSDTRRRVPILSLAWRNTGRNIRRTALTAAAVMVAVTAVIFALAYINGILDNMLDTYARTQAGHVRIRKDGYTERERFMPAHLNVPYLTDLLPVIRTHPAVEEALPRIRTAVLVDRSGSNRPGLLFGLDLEREEGYMEPSGMVVEGRMPVAGAPETMIGRGLAGKLEVTTGDTLTLLGQTAYRSLGGIRLVITGIAASGLGYLDETVLFAPIDQVQLMADLDDAATEIVVFARDPETSDLLAGALREELGPLVIGELEVLSWHDQGPIMRMVESASSIWGVMFLILLGMACLITVNTMLMTVLERTREFGMLSALGMRRSDIVRLILSEGLAIGILGALVGVAIGSGLSIWVEYTGINLTAAMSDIEWPIMGIVYPDWQVSYALLGGLLGMAAAELATLYPAWRAVRLTPAEALRS